MGQPIVLVHGCSDDIKNVRSIQLPNYPPVENGLTSVDCPIIWRHQGKTVMTERFILSAPFSFTFHRCSPHRQPPLLPAYFLIIAYHRLSSLLSSFNSSPHFFFFPSVRVPPWEAAMWAVFRRWNSEISSSSWRRSSSTRRFSSPCSRFILSKRCCSCRRHAGVSISSRPTDQAACLGSKFSRSHVHTGVGT